MGQLEDMEMFIRIVDAGSITKAAEQSGLVKSAISRRLKELEERLNVKLINRTTRQSHLTEEGKYYYDKAKNILNEVQLLNEYTSGKKASVEGTLRVSVPLSFGIMHFADVVNTFIQQHPQVDFELDFSDRKVDLVEEGFELAVRIGDLQDSTYQAKRLTPINFTLCASPDYLKQNGTPQTADDLEQHIFLQYGLDKKVNLDVIDSDGVKSTITIHSKIKSTNGEFLADMAINNYGITFLPAFLSYHAIKRGALVPLLPDYQLPSLNAYAVYPKNRFLSQRCRLFIDHLKDYFGDEPYWDNPIDNLILE